MRDPGAVVEHSLQFEQVLKEYAASSGLNTGVDLKGLMSEAPELEYGLREVVPFFMVKE